MKKLFAMAALLAFVSVISVGCGKKEDKAAERPAISISR